MSDPTPLRIPPKKYEETHADPRFGMRGYYLEIAADYAALAALAKYAGRTIEAIAMRRDVTYYLAAATLRRVEDPAPKIIGCPAHDSRHTPAIPLTQDELDEYRRLVPRKMSWHRSNGGAF